MAAAGSDPSLPATPRESFPKERTRGSCYGGGRIRPIPPGDAPTVVSEGKGERVLLWRRPDQTHPSWRRPEGRFRRKGREGPAWGRPDQTHPSWRQPDSGFRRKLRKGSAMANSEIGWSFASGSRRFTETALTLRGYRAAGVSEGNTDSCRPTVLFERLELPRAGSARDQFEPGNDDWA